MTVIGGQNRTKKQLARMKWGELESQGVRRCCAMFKDGTRCRARSVEQFEWSWCAKHGQLMKAAIDQAYAAMRKESES